MSIRILVVEAAAGREQEHRYRILAVPKFAQHGQSVAIGQTEIEDHRRIGHHHERVAGLGDGPEDVDIISGGVQAFRQQRGQLLVVFYDQ